MRTRTKVLLGCLASPFILVLVFGLLALVFRAVPIPASRRVSVDSGGPIGEVTPGQLAAEGFSLHPGAVGVKAVPVTIRLEEGSFTLKPAPAGTGLHVQGDYDRSVYELTSKFARDAQGSPSYTVTFLPKYSMFRRLLTQGFVHLDDDTNILTVYIPRDLPIDLDLSISKGESRLYLGGMALASAKISLSMGDHRLYAKVPNRMEMDSLELNCGMGDIRLHDLGNLRAKAITVWGKMGDLRLHLGDELSRDTRLFARMRMGEMRIGLPKRAQVSTRSAALLGDTTGNARNKRYDTDPEAPKLDIDASVTLGSLIYHR